MRAILRFHLLFVGILAISVFCLLLEPACAEVRIKEIAQFSGVRDNQIMGYGLVVGLNGTGDKGKSVFTVKAIASMLRKMGLMINSADVKVKNSAAVMITAILPPFVKPGTKIDVTLSSLGDAKSLLGGTLLQSPLQGPDGKVYAVAQGSISIASTDGNGVQNMTVARIPDGALVEREVPVTMEKDGFLALSLVKTDFTTCSRAAEAINVEFGQVIAYPEDGSTIKIKIPELFRNDLVKFISKIERIQIVPDYRSTIVINERTGTIVGGKEVKISEVSLTHMNLNIQIKGKKENAVAAQARSVVELSHYNEALFKEGEALINDVPEGGEITVGELAKYLNSLGIAPKDMIAILHSIKAAGAIQSDIQII
ncbi:MAG: flagellar basal body P-ring protein FlgI [Candidatus Omnitrophica bacterium]|nr:flagellar basal body P-ring protein FlgI [Candidatus Omnitrophota bacterium]